jgi:hypothetical protein
LLLLLCVILYMQHACPAFAELHHDSVRLYCCYELADVICGLL